MSKVEWKKFGDVCDILDSQRKPVAKGNRSHGVYPYYGANGIQDYVDDYIFDGTYLLLGEDGSVINKDNSPVLHWATGKIWVNNHAHVLQENDKALLRYLYYALQCTDVSDIVRGMPPKLNQANMRTILIPIPSISEQNRIVEILDTFTASIDNLKEQIALRRKQYEYYRDQLLDLEGKEGVEAKMIGDICFVKTGVKPEAIKEKGYYRYVNAGTSESGFLDRYNCASDVVTTPSRGQGGIGFVAYQTEDFWLGPLCYQLRPLTNEIICAKYLYYYLTSHNDVILKCKSEGGTPAVNAQDLKKITLLYPSKDEQSRIVSILDTFEASIANLEAQLKEREKQYEYYRNKLLTFE